MSSDLKLKLGPRLRVLPDFEGLFLLHWDLFPSSWETWPNPVTERCGDVSESRPTCPGFPYANDVCYKIYTNLVK